MGKVVARFPKLSVTQLGLFDYLGPDSSTRQEEFALRVERKGSDRQAQRKRAAGPRSPHPAADAGGHPRIPWTGVCGVREGLFLKGPRLPSTMSG